MKKIMISLIAVMFVLTSVFSYAQKGPNNNKGPKDGKGMFIEEISKVLKDNGLSDKDIKYVLDEHKKLRDLMQKRPDKLGKEKADKKDKDFDFNSIDDIKKMSQERINKIKSEKVDGKEIKAVLDNIMGKLNKQQREAIVKFLTEKRDKMRNKFKGKNQGKGHNQGKGNKDCKGDRKDCPKDMFKELNLTDDQKKKIENLHKEHMEQREKNRTEKPMKNEMEKLHKAFIDGKVTEKMIEDMLEKGKEKHIEFIKHSTDALIDFVNILTPEQLKIAKEKGMLKHFGRHHKGHHPGPPCNENGKNKNSKNKNNKNNGKRG